MRHRVNHKDKTNSIYPRTYPILKPSALPNDATSSINIVCLLAVAPVVKLVSDDVNAVVVAVAVVAVATVVPVVAADASTTSGISNLRGTMPTMSPVVPAVAAAALLPCKRLDAVDRDVTISVFTPFGVFVIVTFTMVLLDGTVVAVVIDDDVVAADAAVVVATADDDVAPAT